MVLNFEYCDDELDIIFDNEGINIFMQYLKCLLDDKDTHYHLMTESWGGFELTEKLFNENANLINHVRLQKIKNK